MPFRPKPFVLKPTRLLPCLLLLVPLLAAAAAPGAGDFEKGRQAQDAGNYAAALAAYQHGADQGHAASAAMLGYLYSNGLGVPADKGRARELYRRAAELGATGAMYNLGVMLRDGEGGPRDIAAAIDWFKKADAQGTPIAARQLALIYDDGDGVPVDKAEAVKWYRRAAEGGNADAMYGLAQAYASGSGVAKDDAQSALWWGKAAEQDHAPSLYRLAYLYDEGIGVPQDDARAMTLYRRAADLGNRDAMFNLAVSYGKGDGVPVDLAQQYYWHFRAAELGRPESAYNLSVLYWNGEGVPKDMLISKYWCQRAADLGHAKAQKELADYAEAPARASGGAEEYQQALQAYTRDFDKVKEREWYRKAWAKGHAGAGAALLEDYFTGHNGVTQDFFLARQIALPCALHDNSFCQMRMAQMAYKGLGGPKSADQAREWFERAALNKNTEAMIRLGDLYDRGDGIARNDALATYWYKQAYAKVDFHAEQILKQRGLIKPDPAAVAFIERLHANGGPTRSSVDAFLYEAMMYCKLGGPRCHEYNVAAQQFMKQQNAQADSARLQRIWNAYAPEQGSDDAKWRAKSECMRRKTESIQRSTYGQQDWKFVGDC